MSIQESLRNFWNGFIRQVKILIGIAGFGAVFIVSSMILLTFSNDLEPISKTLSLVGLKVMIFGYPVYLFYLFLKLLFQKKSREP